MTVQTIFQDAVRSSATHRKNYVALRKLHLKRGREVEKDILKCVARIVPLKKGFLEAERGLKFLDVYFENFRNDAPDSESSERVLLDALLNSLLQFSAKGLRAKDKNVRYRSCQLAQVTLNHKEDLEDDQFTIMRDGLIMRTRDKEASVRAKATSALSRLQDSGDEEDDFLIRQVMLSLLRFDSHADVRRSAVLNISVDDETRPFLLQRVRDVDPNVRKAAYDQIGREVQSVDSLTTEEIEALLGSGLSDRNANVQKACVELMCDRWLPQYDDKILLLLRQMDVMSGSAAEAAAKAYMLVNPGITAAYEDEAWDNLDEEEAFFLCAAISFFYENKMEDELENALPPLIRHAELLQKYGLLMSQTENQDETIAFAFILKQLLLIAEYQDFSDEMGRREMLLALRDMVSTLDLSKENILIIVRIIKRLSTNESDFTRVVIEVLYTIYDADLADSSSQPIEEYPDDERAQMDKIEKSLLLLKCLDVINCVLECTEENLQNNAAMTGILDSFILPALKNEHPAIQQSGFHCLSLACLLDRNLAETHLQLFMSAFNDAREGFSTLALKVFFDLTILFGTNLLLDTGLLIEVIRGTLQCDDEKLLTLAVEGVAKLMMLGYLSDELILQQVVVLYYHPHTRKMNRLRQCLSYFLPVFAHASHRNQLLLKAILVPAVQILAQEHHVSKDLMIQPLQIAQQLVDWTDVRKVVGSFNQNSTDVDSGIHADLAIEILHALLNEAEPSVMKLYAQMLGKLYIGQDAGETRLRTIGELASSALGIAQKGSTFVLPLKRFANAVAEIEVSTSVAE